MIENHMYLNISSKKVHKGKRKCNRISFKHLEKIIKPSSLILFPIIFLLVALSPSDSFAWHDETHLAIAKAAGYKKWYCATGADMAKIKAGQKEALNHFVNNEYGTVIDRKMVIKQIKKYDKLGFNGHLYGAVIASLRNYVKEKKEGKYGEYHLAFCAHYVGDLSQPLHHSPYNDYNKTYHKQTDGIINDEVLKNISKIKLYPIKIHSEEDIIKEVVRIANLSLKKAYQIEREKRILSKKEAYEQISHSSSLFKAILEYVGQMETH